MAGQPLGLLVEGQLREVDLLIDLPARLRQEDLMREEKAKMEAEAAVAAESPIDEDGF
jgi:hypothetical protein